jgi:hypothetical protein
MMCSRIYDFVTGTEVVLAAPPCHAIREAAPEGPNLDILRPNPAAKALIKQHEETLLKLRQVDAA